MLDSTATSLIVSSSLENFTMTLHAMRQAAQVISQVHLIVRFIMYHNMTAVRVFGDWVMHQTCLFSLMIGVVYDPLSHVLHKSSSSDKSSYMHAVCLKLQILYYSSWIQQWQAILKHMLLIVCVQWRRPNSFYSHNFLLAGVKQFLA